MLVNRDPRNQVTMLDAKGTFNASYKLSILSMVHPTSHACAAALDQYPHREVGPSWRA